MDAAFQEELQHLHEVTGRISAQLDRLRQKEQPAASGDPDEAETADIVAAQVVAATRAQLADALQRALQEPYFGRLDFAEGDQPIPERLYIGKRGILDPDSGDPIVIDWRAPVASMFYTFSGQQGQDRAGYMSPDGWVEGRIDRKRNIVIRQGKLQRVVDSYVRGEENLGVADEFLLYRLSEHRDHRLRDIVATIQAEQDRIIRADRNLAVVIQGVAGSGKTTVALHRLAYLLYQYADRMRPERMIIFAPNAMFVDYISEVLPELGVGGIQQTTFTRWALAKLGHQVRLRDPRERLARWFAVQPDPALAEAYRVLKYKGSPALREVLDQAVVEWTASAVPDVDFSPWAGEVLPAATIREWFYADYRHEPPLRRRDRVLARVKRWYETRIAEAEWSREEKAARRQQAANRYHAYASRWPDVTPWALYEALLRKDSAWTPNAAAAVPDWVAAYHRSLRGQGASGSRIRRAADTEAAAATGANQHKADRSRPALSAAGEARRPLVDAEDLAGILYLDVRLRGVRSDETFDHVVIDEAQDFSPLQIILLQQFCPQGSFTILGDLSQSIHSYQGIDDWEEFLRLFPAERRTFHKLDVSYRSTMEIIEFANQIAAGTPGFVPARPVFRSGEPVRVEPVAAEERYERAAAAVARLQAEHTTIAVICRSDAACDEYARALAASGIPAHRIGAGDEHYEGGVSVLPVYLAKGLEFDAVLMVDVDESSYTADPLSAKLLFVGCTRALHQLWLQYSGRPSPLLPAGVHPQAHPHMYGVGETGRPLSRTS
ncbi:HelD family protein [Alicyclobacillus cellulosilyticus]|uniref:HelD family protein n=1 Tax=Alicyclobacillus cellulosilyticus TaxID=1003997 RepID=UPI001668D281|nr:UvrD-helicase domain-containing protein [Alicyclobacillus cellulosilyticus]